MTTLSFSPYLLKASKRHNPGRTPHFGRRLNEEGKFLYEPGNTVVCHLVEGSETQRAIIAARDSFLNMPEARQLAFTAVTSLHMTLFQGIIEFRREAPFWPTDIDVETPIDEMTELMELRLQSFPVARLFKVEVTGARPEGLLVDGVTAEDRSAMRAWRDAFADILGYRHPDHETYPFHITFDYIIDKFEDDALPRWQDLLDGVTEKLRKDVPVLELDPPAFCTFNDMNHFAKRLVFPFNAA